MKRFLILAVLAIPTVASANSLTAGLDNIGVYGQIVGTPTTLSATVPGYGSATASGGNTTGGIGVSATGINQQLWFMHLGFNYAFGPAIDGGSAKFTSADGVSESGSGSANDHGHSLQFNARLGKAFEVAHNVIVGPYLGYQYAKFSLGLDGYSASYGNNAFGGGVYAAMAPTNQITLSGHIGYLAGVSATATGATHTPSSDVLQVGAKADYRFDPNWSGFIGVDYDRYSASDQVNASVGSVHINDVRGLVGMAYHY
ncbi:MAG: hypothetical protein AB7C98_10140 [Acidithiobacillus sp.]